MRYRRIPGTDISVSEVGFRINSVGFPLHFDKKAADHLFHYAIDRGVNFFEVAETADQEFYEKLLGDVLFEERDRIVISSKCLPTHSKKGTPVKENLPQSLTGAELHKICDETLKRFRTDYLDFLQLNNPGMTEIQKEDLFAMLEKLRKVGKIKAWGASFVDETEWLKPMMELVSLRGPRMVQLAYDAWHFENAQNCRDCLNHYQVGLVGVLPHFCHSFLQGAEELMLETRWLTETIELSDREEMHRWLSDFLFSTERRVHTLRQALLKYMLADTTMISVMAEILTEEHLNEVAGISELNQLSTQEQKKINQVFAHREKSVREKNKIKDPKE